MLRSLSRLALAFFLSLAVAAGTPLPAFAYSTRVHIAMANRVREALIESGDGTIRLEWSTYSVTLPAEDAQAIIDAFEHADPKDVTTRNTASRTRPQYRNWRAGNQFGSKFLGISTVPDAVFFKVRDQDGTESAVVRIPVS